MSQGRAPVAYLDLTGVADLLGLSVATVRTYRRDGRLPAPEITLGRSPGWSEAAVREWAAGRPGKGGRPRRPQ